MLNKNRKSKIVSWNIWVDFAGVVVPWELMNKTAVITANILSIPILTWDQWVFKRGRINLCCFGRKISLVLGSWLFVSRSRKIIILYFLFYWFRVWRMFQINCLISHFDRVGTKLFLLYGTAIHIQKSSDFWSVLWFRMVLSGDQKFHLLKTVMNSPFSESFEGQIHFLTKWSDIGNRDVEVDIRLNFLPFEDV